MGHTLRRLNEERGQAGKSNGRIIFVRVPKGRRGNNLAFFAEDFRRLPRSVDEDISGICRGGATKAGGEKTSKECEVIFASALSIEDTQQECYEAYQAQQDIAYRTTGMYRNQLLLH